MERKRDYLQLGLKVARHKFIGDVHHRASSNKKIERRYYDNTEKLTELTIYSEMMDEVDKMKIYIVSETKLPLLLKQSKGFRQFLKDFEDYIIFRNC